MTKYISKLAMLIFAFSFCPSPLTAQTPPVEQPNLNMLGGLDGGGGQGGSSTPAQVRAAIAKAYEIAARKDAYANVFVRFWKSETGGRFRDGGSFDPRHLFPSLKVAKPGDEDYPTEDMQFEIPDRAEWPLIVVEDGDDNAAANFVSPGIAAVLANPPELLDKGDCQQGTRSHADASTSSFAATGKVCFSIGNLTRFPSSAVLGEVLSLILHEAIHLSGVRDEREPDEWQSEFNRYFRYRFGVLEEEHVRDKTLTQLRTARDYLNHAKYLHTNWPRNPGIFAVLGAVGRIVVTLPYLFDPIGLDLALNPKNLDLVNNYSNSALALYAYGSNEIMRRGRFYLSNPKALGPLIDLLIAHLRKVEENFIAFADGYYEPVKNRGSHCLANYPYVPLELLFDRQDQFSKFGVPNIYPPKICDPGTVMECTLPGFCAKSAKEKGKRRK